MWKRITAIIDEWFEKHTLFVGWLWSGLLFGLSPFTSHGWAFWVSFIIWLSLTVALIILLYKWIADLVEWGDTMDKKLDAILEKLK